MSKVILAALLCLPVLVPLGNGPARAADENSLGLFFDPDATAREAEAAPNTMQSLYLVLLDPINESFDGGGTRDVNYVLGFECSIIPPGGDYVLGVDFPLPAINVGYGESIVAGYAYGLPVTSNRTATLAVLSVMTGGANPEGYRLGPADPASMPNAMVYVDSEDPDNAMVPMVPVSGSFDRPVFNFGNFHTEEGRMWGDVKSLYR